jgi:hypothetical protein
MLKFFDLNINFLFKERQLKSYLQIAKTFDQGETTPYYMLIFVSQCATHGLK